MMQTMRSRVRRGFTLIELLVVIAIIAILAAILFPVFAQARARARATACLSNLKQIGTGLMMYNQDYDETMPGAFVLAEPKNGGTRFEQPLDTQLMPYIKNDAVWNDPDDPHAVPQWAYDSSDFHDASYKTKKMRRSYGSYVGAIDTIEGGQDDPNTGMSVWQRGNALASIEAPADTIALVDTTSSASESWPMGMPWGSFFTGCDTWKLPGRKANQDLNKVTSRCAGDQYKREPWKGHYDKGNYVFADGHVKALSWGQVVKNDFDVFKLRKTQKTWPY
jgi:prepilin-type N-terminal cleavage/methylation domain-containing protein/prepilin-type processing-associated H-X9-DG protein